MVTSMLLKAKKDIKGKTLPRLDSSKYSREWDDLYTSLEFFHKEYHNEATKIWIKTWNDNNCEFGVSSGVIKLLSTNIQGMDWGLTFKDFKAGRITTGKVISTDK